jgi:hypothetical protein
MSNTAAQSLVEMGFDKKKAEKALLQAKGSIDQAIQILSSDDPMEVDTNDQPTSVLDSATSSSSPSSPSSTSSSSSSSSPSSSDNTTGVTPDVVRGYKCNETGKVFRTMADVHLYSERTGRTDFSETTEEKKPRTAEELKADTARLKELIKKKRAEKELAEKKRQREAEIARRQSGKQSGTIKEEMEAKQRKIMYAKQKKEKKLQAMERERLRREIAKDKAERKARGGKLAGKLSAEGYAPAGNNLNAKEQAEQIKLQKEREMEERRKILAKGGVKGFVEEMSKEERLEKALKALSIQKARDAGKIALMTIRKMLHRININPTEDKYKTINLNNDTFRRKVLSKPGGLNLLLSAGFVKTNDEKIVMPNDFNSEWVQNVIDQAGVVLSKLTN